MNFLSEEETACISRLPSARKLRAEIPRSETSGGFVSKFRGEIEAILEGRDTRRVLIVCGPCSIHDTNAALEYAERLQALSDRVRDEALLVMRTYFEKPRSVAGWKGMVYDPELAGARADLNGLAIARRLLACINENGMPCATEFLNPLLAPYFQDLISYGSIGARTIESQIHRELAAGLPMPIGMKNSLSGDIQSAVNAIKASSRPHSAFSTDDMGRTCIAHLDGNPMSHVFLRGGRSGSNCDIDSIRLAARLLGSDRLRRPVMVDCSHANSEKDFRKQGVNARKVAQLFGEGVREVAGIMLESNLKEGSQAFRAGTRHDTGRSITDGCIGWIETESIVLEIARGIN